MGEPSWWFDQGEVVITLIGAIISVIIAAYKIGGKITHLEVTTSQGLEKNSSDLQGVRVTLNSLRGDMRGIEREQRKQHDTLLIHGEHLSSLDERCLVRQGEIQDDRCMVRRGEAGAGAVSKRTYEKPDDGEESI